MTSINILIQPKHRLAHVVSDGAHYRPNGVLTGIGSKVFPVPSWPGCITGRGSSIVLTVINEVLSCRYQSFDDLLDEVEEVVPDILARHPIIPKGSSADLLFVGWSTKRQGHECYALKTEESGPVECTLEYLEQGYSEGSALKLEPMQLRKLDDEVRSPFLTIDFLLRHNFKNLDDDTASPEDAVRHLRRIIEYQRHVSPPGQEHCCTGGFVQHTEITDRSITQRILHHWPEDEIGFVIEPAPVDWSAFRASFPASDFEWSQEDHARVQAILDAEEAAKAA